MSAITLEQYEAAERDMSLRETLIGLRIHALIIVLVSAALIPINIFVAPEFPWPIFVVAGTAIGLFFHWFGYRHAEQDIRRRQQRIEQRAANQRQSAHGGPAAAASSQHPSTWLHGSAGGLSAGCGPCKRVRGRRRRNKNPPCPAEPGPSSANR